MPKHFIFPASLTNKGEIKTYTVVFIPQDTLLLDQLFSELKLFFQENYIPDHLVMIIGEHLKAPLSAFLAADDSKFKEIIPTRYHQENLYDKFVSILSFDADGALHLEKGVAIGGAELFKKLFRIGLTKIFNRGGLIHSQEAHHFEFPSGKHCDRFLRTGNVLIHSEEIFFIAFNILSRVNSSHEIIYCDTSSINSLAFAIVELKRRISPSFKCPHIQSYGSYKVFEETTFVDSHKAFFLISSSTSANIINRLTERHIEASRVALVFCIAPTQHAELVICDLSYDGDNEKGIVPFKTYSHNERCELCELGSMPVKVQGDVFLLEKPSVNKIVLATTDAPPNLSSFVNEYHARNVSERNFIKSNYFESTVRAGSAARYAYEVFFDVSKIFESISSATPEFPDFKVKLDRYINQYIPTNTSIIIYLKDDASKHFAEYLRNQLQQKLIESAWPKLVSMDKISEMDIESSGAAVIVSSSLVSGGNLIYVSKELRKFENLSLIYLIGFSRTSDEAYLKFIRNNLTQGKHGITTNSFHSIETIHCNNEYKNTPWSIELDFVRSFIQYTELYVADGKDAIIAFFKEREVILTEASKNSSKGLANELFYRNIYTGEPLSINKNFAFFKFTDYDQHVSQADLFFTVSTVINRLRSQKDNTRTLRQTEYVRNILDPENFARFNDGIIQASILRSAHPLELAYEVDDELGRKFITIFTPIVVHAKSNYGEALLEFLYAVALKKLRLSNRYLEEMCSLVMEFCPDHPVVVAMINFIRRCHIERDPEIVKDYQILFPIV